MSAETPTLAAALVALQSKLPHVTKGETARVKPKDGQSYSYSYATLADATDQIMPSLAEVGLAFTARPTVTEDGRFVLAYSLIHISGEREDGQYPLPQAGPQQVGSAITYARRYCLLAVTGVAPDEDDDAQAAQSAPSAWETARPAAPANPELVESYHKALADAGDVQALQNVAATIADARNQERISNADGAELYSAYKARAAELKNGQEQPAAVTA